MERTQKHIACNKNIMILSVSRRTDIPAFYSEWFFNRIKAGFVDVRNPMNIHQVSRVNIKPEVVDCIVFWTKNAGDMLARLDELKDYKFYFQYTINPYNKFIEENVPVKKGIIENFRRLSDLIGSDKVIWRYDPILITNEIDIEYHFKYFEELAKRLEGYTKRCVISFVDLYKKTITNTQGLAMREPTEKEMHILADCLSGIAKHYGIEVQSCSENVDLDSNGVTHGCCIDKNIIEQIIGYEISIKKDQNQRKECGCVQSIDVGAYNTCRHACKYCYANFNNTKVQAQSKMHNPLSSMLVGELKEDDVVKERSVSLLKVNNLFV